MYQFFFHVQFFLNLIKSSPKMSLLHQTWMCLTMNSASKIWHPQFISKLWAHRESDILKSISKLWVHQKPNTFKFISKLWIHRKSDIRKSTSKLWIYRNSDIRTAAPKSWKIIFSRSKKQLFWTYLTWRIQKKISKQILFENKTEITRHQIDEWKNKKRKIKTKFK